MPSICDFFGNETSGDFLTFSKAELPNHCTQVQQHQNKLVALGTR